MSASEKAFGLLKNVMLMTERFDALDARMKTIAADQTALSRSLVELARQVAEIEGYLRGATRTPFGERSRLEER